MRFKFCGDRDCPDWLLAEIASMSKMSSVKIKLLGVQIVSSLLGTGMDHDKINKLTADSKFTHDDLKGIIVALEYIFRNATRFAVDEESLVNELQQLGLPKEHSTSLSKVYADKSPDILEVLKKKSLRLSCLEGNPSWRVDYVLESSVAGEVNAPSIQMNLRVKEEDVVTPVHFTLPTEKCGVLLHELKAAHKLMKELEQT
ncbi:COMM domain-containing protein 4-like [Ornithodoros turicata]|uniref:COMM domain-containing protein 4-like n=1 Tax=Ornithodoros turicata TaxID=34597 RepID=UPI00313A17C3